MKLHRFHVCERIFRQKRYLDALKPGLIKEHYECCVCSKVYIYIHIYKYKTKKLNHIFSLKVF